MQYVIGGQLKCDGTPAEIRFLLLAKRTSPFKSAGASVQSTTGSRGVRISGSNAGYTMFRGSVKGTGYTLHSAVSPSLPLPCVNVCHHISTGVYRGTHWSTKMELRQLQFIFMFKCFPRWSDSWREKSFLSFRLWVTSRLTSCRTTFVACDQILRRPGLFVPRRIWSCFLVVVWLSYLYILAHFKSKDVSEINWAPQHEGARGSADIAPLILMLSTKWWWVISCTS